MCSDSHRFAKVNRCLCGAAPEGVICEKDAHAVTDFKFSGCILARLFKRIKQDLARGIQFNNERCRGVTRESLIEELLADFFCTHLIRIETQVAYTCERCICHPAKHRVRPAILNSPDGIEIKFFERGLLEHFRLRERLACNQGIAATIRKVIECVRHCSLRESGTNGISVVNQVARRKTRNLRCIRIKGYKSPDIALDAIGINIACQIAVFDGAIVVRCKACLSIDIGCRVRPADGAVVVCDKAGPRFYGGVGNAPFDQAMVFADEGACIRKVFTGNGSAHIAVRYGAGVIQCQCAVSLDISFNGHILDRAQVLGRKHGADIFKVYVFEGQVFDGARRTDDRDKCRLLKRFFAVGFHIEVRDFVSVAQKFSRKQTGSISQGDKPESFPLNRHEVVANGLESINVSVLPFFFGYCSIDVVFQFIDGREFVLAVTNGLQVVIGLEQERVFFGAGTFHAQHGRIPERYQI